MQRLIPVLLLWALCGTAGAQTLYKCTVNGKLTYSGSPCPGAPSKAIEVPEAPPANPGAAADLKRQQAAAATLEKARVARERADQREQLRAGDAAQARRLRCDKLALEAKWAEEEAVGGTSAERDDLTDKARRKREMLAVECPV